MVAVVAVVAVVKVKVKVKTKIILLLQLLDTQTHLRPSSAFNHPKASHESILILLNSLSSMIRVPAYTRTANAVSTSFPAASAIDLLQSSNSHTTSSTPHTATRSPAVSRNSRSSVTNVAASVSAHRRYAAS